MIRSMTGYGKKETQWEDKRISIEIRALNSKNADINLRTPSYLRIQWPKRTYKNQYADCKCLYGTTKSLGR